MKYSFFLAIIITISFTNNIDTIFYGLKNRAIDTKEYRELKDPFHKYVSKKLKKREKKLKTKERLQIIEE